MGCYMALHRAHIPTRFVDIDQLKMGALSSYDVLYIPYSYAMDDQAAAALHNFVSNGGTLWADGLTAWKNETGEIRPTIPGGLSDLFGIQASDIYPVKADEPYSVTSQNERGGELWKLPLELKGAEVILRDQQGKPFATQHHFGKGQAIYFESAVTLGYFKRNNPLVQQWIIDPAMKVQANAPVQVEKAPSTVGFRGLLYKSGPVAILTNWGDMDTVVVSFRGDYAVADTLTGAPVEVTHQQGTTLATVKLPAGAVSVLRARKAKE
jgi:beta-galactosidase GanA